MLRPLLEFTLVMVLNLYVVTAGDQNIKLVGGLDACSGRVQIYGTQQLDVCGGSWDINVAAVLCRQLECGRAVIADVQALFGVGSSLFSINISCKGTESSFTQCTQQKKENPCPPSNFAGVICSGSSVIIIAAVVAAVLFILCILIIIFLVRKRQKQKKIRFSSSKDAINMQDVLQNNQNEENAEGDYEVVDMDDGDRKDANSDAESDQDYVNVDKEDSDPDYVNVETDDSEQDYVNVDVTEHRSTPGNNYEDL
ncbi:scavenger receptor cysteine-rich type 1 protein M130 isoform X1 [Carassius gibelio]|uniref:scavenger receptor cysteine-rich type 1 protein M130 isoform X1 n=1 Tax=Carassius gibelio TaxID=101364 RepID=UPI002279BA5A|nr:scavenger receptor cysteine-rich type 1 protein M130 isoform X1 [Carassius gibelio]